MTLEDRQSVEGEVHFSFGAVHGVWLAAVILCHCKDEGVSKYFDYEWHLQGFGMVIILFNAVMGVCLKVIVVFYSFLCSFTVCIGNHV